MSTREEEKQARRHILVHHDCPVDNPITLVDNDGAILSIRPSPDKEIGMCEARGDTA